MDFREFMDLSAKKAPIGPKLWKAKQADVIRMWQDLRPDMPIVMTPVSKLHQGSRYAEDGIRITGSSTFINSVIGKLKDILAQESPSVEVDVEFRQIADKSGVNKHVPKFVFYVHLNEKKSDDKKDKKIELPKLPGLE